MGSHGTGKSSGSAYLASLLKRQYPEKSVIVLEENVRKVSRVLEGAMNTPEFQKLVITDQIVREIEATSLHDIVICDRSTIDPVVYGAVLSEVPSAVYMDLAIDNMTTYNKIFFVRPDNYQQAIVNDSFRLMNLNTRNEVDEAFASWLSEHVQKNISEVRTTDIFTYDYLKELV